MQYRVISVIFTPSVSPPGGGETSPPTSRGRNRGGIKTIIEYNTIRILILLFLTSIIQVSIAQIITVKQDGTGDYTIIQDAVNASVDGDTVLIWPGTYYENVDFIGKNITLASLMLTTGDESYKYSTIIDGNNNGSCVKVMSGETGAILYGLSLQHGSGTNFAHPVLHYGGGIIITYSSCSVINCVISNNHVDRGGGGICCSFYSSLYISNTSIFKNHANGYGGGILFAVESIIQFDSVSRCNLYLNYAGKGCDFSKSNNDSLTIFLDTCTVINPDSYFVSSTDQNGYQKNDITFNIQNHIITPKDADLYVNPQTGDNNNVGLTSDDPLKSIAFAYSTIVVDSIEKNTIHLADGIYSDSANNEKFPFNIRPYINVVGESRNNTILDGMYKSRIIKGNNEVSNYSFSKMTMQRGGYVYYSEDHGPAGFAFLYAQNDNIVLDSIHFKNGHNYPYGGQLNIQASNNVHIKNCEFSNNIGGMAIHSGSNTGDTISISNCIFTDNMPDYQHEILMGGAMALIGYQTATIVQGCLFTGNNNYNVGLYDSYTFHNNFFINCTFTENALLESNVSIGVNDASLFMYNCILYNDGGSEPISLIWSEAIDTISLEIYNSLIEGGVESIYVRPDGPTSLHYDETNIDADPLFYGGTWFPYMLSEYSPCIDAGTLDLPDFIELPETDLAGNPRIYNDSIDMGAYEYGPWVGLDYYNSKVKSQKLLKAAPNPFNYSTYISYITKESGHIIIDVYDMNGRKVSILMDVRQLPGSGEFYWDGTDDYGRKLPAGAYIINLIINDKIKESVKIIKK